MSNPTNNSQRPMNTQKPNDMSKKDESITHKLGDTLERLGEKVIKAGAPKLGKAIYNAGDKIEHMRDDKKSH